MIQFGISLLQIVNPQDAIFELTQLTRIDLYRILKGPNWKTSCMEYQDVSKNRGGPISPKMDGENNGSRAFLSRFTLLKTNIFRP